mmetsp:Transcript_105997/g.167357  ORF Transcript_105997/g.167357 Transcript_105997/m.167357 type:complete len:272 (+) Transcript_105997:55-870(+)
MVRSWLFQGDPDVDFNAFSNSIATRSRYHLALSRASSFTNQGGGAWDTIVSGLKPETQDILKKHPDLTRHLKGQVEDQLNQVETATNQAKSQLKEQLDGLGSQWQKDPAALDLAEKEVNAESYIAAHGGMPPSKNAAESSEEPPPAVDEKSDGTADATAPNAESTALAVAANAKQAGVNSGGIPKNVDGVPSAMEAAKASAGLTSPQAVVPGSAVSKVASEKKSLGMPDTVSGPGDPKPALLPVVLSPPCFVIQRRRHRELHEQKLLASFL